MSHALQPNAATSGCGCFTEDYCIPFFNMDPSTKQVRVVFPGNRDWVQNPASGFPDCSTPPCGTGAFPPCCNDGFYLYVASIENLYHDLDFVSASAPAAGSLDRLIFEGGMPLPQALYDAGLTGIYPFYGFNVGANYWGLTHGTGLSDKSWCWFQVELRGGDDTQFDMRYLPCGSDFPACATIYTSCRLKASAIEPTDPNFVAPGYSIFDDTYNFYTYHFAYDAMNNVWRAAESKTGGGYLPNRVAAAGGPLVFGAGLTP